LLNGLSNKFISLIEQDLYTTSKLHLFDVMRKDKPNFIKTKQKIFAKKKLLRRLLVSFRLARLIQVTDTFIFVYTNHAATLLIYIASAIYLIMNGLLNIHILIIVPLTIFMHLLWKILREYFSVKNITKVPKIYVHAQGDIIRCHASRRKKEYFLGSSIVGHQHIIKIYVHLINYCSKSSPIIVPPSNKNIAVSIQRSRHRKLDNASIYEFIIKLSSQIVSDHKLKISLPIYLDGVKVSDVIFQVNSILKDIPNSHVSKMEIKGWKYGKRAAICWRADFCYLNPKKGMSQKNLEKTVLLGQKYGIPMTLFISGRMTLDKEEFIKTAKYFNHYTEGEAMEIFGQFVDYLKKLKICQKIEYPNFADEVSIGSHSYLHQGLFAGALEENYWNGNWELHEANVRWLYSIVERLNLKVDKLNKFTFNQLNAGLINNLLIYKTLGVYPRSWSAPRNETTDSLATEIEKIGILYSSEADNYKRISKTFFPRRPKLGPCFPYHPKNCTLLVESKCVINPSDPSNIHDIYSLYKTLKYCIKRGYQMTVLIHPHMRIHKSNVGPKLVERFFQRICENLDHLWVASHEAILEFWELTRCKVHSVLYLDPKKLSVSNLSNRPIDGVCIYIKFSTGEEFLKTISIKPKDTIFLFMT